MGNHNRSAAGRALNLRPGSGGVHREFLFAMAALEIDVHINAMGWCEVALSVGRTVESREEKLPERESELQTDGAPISKSACCDPSAAPADLEIGAPQLTR